MKELAEAPAATSYAEALRELFGLDRAAPAAVALAPVQVEEADEPLEVADDDAGRGAA